MNDQIQSQTPEVKVANGLLVLKSVSPVIKALFGEYDLSENGIKEGLLPFWYDSRKSFFTLDTIAFELENLAEDMGIDVDPDIDSDEQIPLLLKQLSIELGSFDEAIYNEVLRQLDGKLESHVLFYMARLLDDGHGISGYYEVEKAVDSNGSIYGDDRQKFVSDHLNFSHGEEFSMVINLVNQAIAAGDVEEAVDAFAVYMNSLISSVKDRSIRTQIQQQIIVPNRIEHDDEPANSEQSGSDVKYYIGTLLLRQGERERQHSVRFKTDGCPKAYLEEVASRYLNDDDQAVEKEDGGYYVQHGEIHVRAKNSIEVPQQFFLDCQTFGAVEFVSY